MYSEIDSAILANSYNTIRGSINLIIAYRQDYLDKTLEKVWKALSFLNDYTDGGFFKLRLVVDSADKKRASVYKIVNGQKIETGWMALIQGIVADKPSKVRGDRTDLLVYEEAGTWPQLTKAFIQSNALVGQPGRLWGFRIGGGTGGDSGASLEGLKDMYYKPDKYGILPFRHNFTADGHTVKTAFFIPCTKIVKWKGEFDKRGYVSYEHGKKLYDEERSKFSGKELVIYAAEYCYTAEEGFSQEGNNNFDKVVIAEQLLKIRTTFEAPTLEVGNLSYLYKTGKHTVENITGHRWEIDKEHGKVHILEHPIWSDLYKELMSESSEEIPHYEKMNNLYVAGIDSIDIGQEDTSENTDNPSKFCIIIFRRGFGLHDPVPVAYYMERPERIRDAYKIAMCMVTYYNAIINIEATRVNMLAWARDNGYYCYFMMRPRATYPDPNKIGKRTPGTPATPNIIDHLIKLIEAYVEDYGYNIWFELLLDLLQNYSLEAKGKFDMVAALGMALLANEELGELVATKVVKVVEETKLVGFYYDEYGRKRFGVIPDKNSNDIIINNNVTPSDGPRTSDPRSWGR